jgi:hypothetical protein
MKTNIEFANLNRKCRLSYIFLGKELSDQGLNTEKIDE